MKNISNLMEVLLEHKDPILRGQNDKEQTEKNV